MRGEEYCSHLSAFVIGAPETYWCTALDASCTAADCSCVAREGWSCMTDCEVAIVVTPIGG